MGKGYCREKQFEGNKEGRFKFALEVSGGVDSLTGKRIRHFETIIIESPLKIKKADRDNEELLQAAIEKARIKAKEKAEDKLVLFKAEISKKDYSKPTKYTFKNYIDDFWWSEYAKEEFRPKTLYLYHYMLHIHILPAIGNINIDAIDTRILSEFYKNLKQYKNKKTGKKLSGTTILHIHKLIKAILETAVKQGYIIFNPAKNVINVPKSENNKDKYNNYPIKDLIIALEQAPLKYKTIAFIALHSGMRLGEIMALNENDINVKTQVISINKTAQYLPENGVFDGPPKTEKSNREITVSKKIIDLIQQQLLDNKKQRLQLGNKWKDSDKIFVTWDGGLMYTYSASVWFRKFLNKHNLPELHFHGLRHIYGSIHYEKFQNIMETQKALGHADASTTTDIYIHLINKENQEEINKQKAEELGELLSV